jgi:hypothetical protein
VAQLRVRAIPATLLAAILALAALGACDLHLQPTPAEKMTTERALRKINEGRSLHMVEIRTEEERMREAIRAEVAAAWAAGHYGVLERLHAGYMDPRARTPSGQWKLVFFHQALAAQMLFDKDDDAGWARLDARFARWRDLHPSSPVPRLARAHAHMQRAWAYRGTRLAKEVDPAAWEPFHAQMQQAQALLEADREIASVDPQWYRLMALVALYQGWPDAERDALEAEILALAPTYYEAVFAAATRHEPKWGGSDAALDAFARRAVAATQATEGEGLYPRIYWSVHGSVDVGWMQDDSRAEWALLRRGMDDVLARYPDEWNRQHFAAMACNSGHAADLRELMKDGFHGYVLNAWGEPRSYDFCSYVAAVGYPH